ncbi:MAG TPA: ATP-binding protein, partial [Pseudomonas sp.]|nr:ATP-binding protein [Pseudomonas sp.]
AEKDGRAEKADAGGFADKAGEFLQSAAGQAIKAAVRQAAGRLGRELVRGVMGSLLGGRRK